MVTIRDLANSIKYQTLINANNEICKIDLFKNKDNLSKIQIIFLNWLRFYKFLRDEVSSDEVSNMVLKDDIYADAYYLWRSKKYKEWYNKSSSNDKPQNNHSLKITHSRKRK